ncbi:MAG: beta-N-acetylhexosaminidase [Bacteroidaceae bacterium]|nr:beta-N-acetylhexosaminidase [Bacteroidaceae bacterium]
MRRLLFLSLLFLHSSLFIQKAAGQRADYHIIPLPKEMKVDSTQVFVLRDGMGIAYDSNHAETTRIARFLQTWVSEATGIHLQLTPSDKKAPIQLVLAQPAKKGKKAKMPEEPLSEQQQEAYTITVHKSGITLSALQPVGLFRAAQTLRKSLPIRTTPNPSRQGEGLLFPYAQIQDEPRFSYRGVLLDCGRHFFPVEFIKQFLDAMALHGCNQFHWHLTEDQGWRFEVKALPRLAVEGSVREKTVIGPGNMHIYDNIPYGGYYTQDDCREIVRYAAERYINVVPEIDMPGHMMSALHVFPNLGCTGGPYPVATNWGVMRDVLCGGNPETLEFLKTVFGELCDVFPSKFIHIGGDECPKERWQKCGKCQARIQELGLTSEPKVKVDGDDGRGSQDGRSAENKLQTYLNHEIEQFLASRGRSLIGWDEILAGGLTEDAIVMSWRGTKGGIAAAKQKHRVIMSPNVYAYIDHPQLKDYSKQPRTTDSYQVSCSKIYSFEPVVPDELTAEQQENILGVQANLWTEQVAYPEHAFYQLLPRLASMSEVQWCRPDQKDFNNFKARLPQLEKLYDKLGYIYCHQVE